MSSSLLAVLAAFTPNLAQTASWDCPVPFHDPVTQYLSRYHDEENPCGAAQPGVPLNKIMAAHEAPSPVLLQCQRLGGVHECQAWPRDPGHFSYDWFASGALSTSNSSPTLHPFKSFSCNGTQVSSGGVISVTVTSPFGVASSQSVWVSCGAFQIEY